MNGAEQADPQTAHGVRFGLFGEMRVSRDGIEIAVTQPKQRAMLAMLLAAAGKPVSMSELIDSLWPGEPAASVRNQVHRHIGAVRRVCEPDLPRRDPGHHIVRVGDGYRLVLATEQSDVLRFRVAVDQAQRLVKTGDRPRALLAYLTALKIAAAPAGDNAVRDLPVFVGLEDERLGAIVAAVELCNSPDEYAAVLPTLRAASGQHQLDEALHALEITVLHKTGRSAEALAVYRTIRNALKRELGLAPGAALEAAQAGALQIHVGDASPTPLWQRIAPAQLPSPLPAFAGRRAQLSALVSEGVRSGRLLISGMAGVGKTSFALRYAADTATEFPDGQLYLNLRGFDAATEPTDPLEALRDLLHGLGVTPHALPDSIGARSGLLRSVLAERRVLVLLDNARDYRQVEPLLPGAGRNLVIITSRNAMPGLAVFHQVEPVQLEPFDDDDVVEFFTRRLSAGRVEGHRESLIRLGHACGGLPLALAVVAARAQANPRFPIDLLVAEFTANPARLPTLHAGIAELDLETVFSWSHQGLSKDAADMFAVLSAYPGSEIPTAAAVSMSGLGCQQASAALGELRDANMLRSSGPNRQVFHDLVREYALGQLGDGVDAASHRLISHYVQSTANALASFEQTPTAGPGPALPGIVAEPFASSSQATAWYAEHRQVLHAVCTRAFELGDYRSALRLMLDWRPMSQAIDARHDMLPFAELAIDAAAHVDDLAQKAEAYREAASNFARTDQPDRARAYFEKAAEAYRRSGDQLGLSGVYRSMAVTVPMDPSERVQLLQNSVAIARDLDERPTLAIALHSLGLGFLWAKRYVEAVAAFDQAHGVAADAGNLDHLEPHLLSARSRALARSGRLDEAATDAEQALQRFRHDGATHAELRLLHSHGEVLTALGRTAEAADAWRRYLALATGPEHIRETNALDDDTDGSATIARIKDQLAALSN